MLTHVLYSLTQKWSTALLQFGGSNSGVRGRPRKSAETVAMFKTDSGPGVLNSADLHICLGASHRNAPNPKHDKTWFCLDTIKARTIEQLLCFSRSAHGNFQVVDSYVHARSRAITRTY